jgi:hypothetical protein
MTHPRTQIRNAVVAQLSANLTPPPAQGQQPGAPTYPTAAGARVYSGRLMPIEEPDLPAIVVHTREPEEIQDRSISGWNGFERRRCIVSVVCIAQSFDDIDEDLDTMADQVEAALQSWTIPGFESSDALLLDTKTEDPEFDGALTTGATTLRYVVTYQTPYRECSNPYVIDGDDPLERSGAYPGGQVTPGCPADNSGEACPVADATITANGEELT